MLLEEPRFFSTIKAKFVLLFSTTNDVTERADVVFAFLMELNKAPNELMEDPNAVQIK